MKAILEFNLPEEKENFSVYINAENIYFVLYELDIWLRKIEKYNDVKTIEVTEIRNKLSELLERYNLTLTMLS